MKPNKWREKTPSMYIIMKLGDKQLDIIYVDSK